MFQILGDFDEEQFTASNPFLQLDLSTQILLREHYKRFRYSTLDFFSQSLKLLLLSFRYQWLDEQTQTRILDTAKFVTNELLENALKFHDISVREPILVGISQAQESLLFFTRNQAKSESINKLKVLAEQLSKTSAEELYFNQLEQCALEDSQESGIGFLSMIYDHNARLGWKIEMDHATQETMTLTTQVKLNFAISAYASDRNQDR